MVPKTQKACTTAKGFLAVVGGDCVVDEEIVVGCMAVAHDFGVACEERFKGEVAEHKPKNENILAVLQGPLPSNLGMDQYHFGSSRWSSYWF